MAENDEGQTKARSHRWKKYEFNAKNFADECLPKPPKNKTKAPEPNDAQKLAEHLSMWMRDMKAWGEDVRDDIVRLEAAAHAGTGDPGDPPPAPRSGHQ